MAATMEIQRTQLLDLPTELLQHVLGYLSPIDLSAVARTCRPLSTHSCDDQIWQSIVNSNVPHPISNSSPCKSFRDLYVSHHPHWFLPRHRIWFADTEPSGKLLVARYDQRRGCIEAYAVTAQRGRHTLELWERNPEILIHSFDPKVSLDLNQPVLQLAVDSPETDDQSDHHPSDRGYAPPSRYSKEVLMNTFAEAGLYSAFMLCRALPEVAISAGTRVWPPLRFPAHSRTRNDTRDGFNSAGHRPTRLDEVSQHHFRLRKWVEYSGRRATPNLMAFTSPNGLSAALGLAGPYFAATANGRMSIRMPEDITTYATLPESVYTPTPAKPWQGIWCGDYSGHGCEFLVITQPDQDKEKPLPSGMDSLREWFDSGRRGSNSTDDSYSSAQEEVEFEAARADVTRDSTTSAENGSLPQVANTTTEIPYRQTSCDGANGTIAPSGRLEAIKLTGDPNIPRGEYTFIAPDIGSGGLLRVADEEVFLGARIVRSAGHVANRGFRGDSYVQSQLIMISHDTLAQYWEVYGHMSFYRRVDVDALLKC